MKKTTGILLIICTLTLCLMSCVHKHEWNNASYENPRTCLDCGKTEGLSIKELLLGEWKEESRPDGAYLGFCFTDNGFTANVFLDGKAYDVFAAKGNVTVSNDRIQLINEDGSNYTYFTYTIDENVISLINEDGARMVKIK